MMARLHDGTRPKRLTMAGDQRSLAHSKLAYHLTILTGKNCVFLNSLQESTEIKAWLLLTY